MKSIFYSALLILSVSSGLASCTKNKEEVPSPVEGLDAKGGRNRAELTFEVPGNAKSGKVFYGGGLFKEFAVTDASVQQKIMVEDLQEQEQVLRVVTITDEGVVSDPRAVKVKVYGSTYESGLKPRKWADQVTHSGTSLQFKFDNPAPNETGVRIVFTNTSGTKDSVLMNSTVNAIEVSNIDTSKAYYYYSIYKPEAGVIDDFFSPSVDLKTALMLDFKKSNWTIAGVSGEEAGHGAHNIIDNKSTTSWHSRAGSTTPHWITVDMDNPKFIDGFYYLNHPGNGNGPKSIKIEVSQDNVSWLAVLQMDVSESYFRQRLPLPQTVSARYFRISVLGSVNPAATQTEISEIDTYNVQSISGDNGYQTSTPIPLTNAKAPFTGDGSVAFPAVSRMQKLAGWKHSSNAVVSFDNGSKAFNVFIAPVWGLPAVTNAKVYQTIPLQPGHYLMKIQVGAADGPGDVYGVVASGESLPDYTTVPSAASTIKYANLVEKQNKTVELLIIVTETKPVSFGIVYNLRSQYSATGIPWTTFNLKAFELAKVE